MPTQNLFSEKILQRVLQRYIKELKLSDQAADRILLSLTPKPPP